MTVGSEPHAAGWENRVDQTNHQTMHVHIHNGSGGADRTGRMVGTAVQDEGEPLSNAEVQLFFGPIGTHPIATARTDGGGGFTFHDLPAGFYGLRLRLPGNQLIHLHNLRVRAGETCQPRMCLTGEEVGPRFARALEEAEADFVVCGLRMEQHE